jgi:hypothetical protein
MNNAEYFLADRYMRKYGYLPHTTLFAVSDDEFQESLANMQQFNSFTLREIAHTHNLSYNTDGKMDQATQLLLEMPRCGCPDISPLGSGRWPHGCYGDWHELRIKVNRAGMPSALAPIFGQVLELVKAAALDIGMVLTFVDDSYTGPINIDFSFERLRGSTIGLAIVPSAPRCSSRIWCKYHPGYTPSDMLNQWARLIAHEIGHNWGLGHTSGGVMNPGILSGPFSRTEWRGDPSEGRLRGWYGGHNPPGPDPDPDPALTFDTAIVATDAGFYMSPGELEAEFTIDSHTFKGKARKL